MMALLDRILAFLFGFAFQMTLVAMSFVGFLAPATPFENLVQRFAVVAGWIVLLAGIAAVLIATPVAWLVPFITGFTVLLFGGGVALGVAAGARDVRRRIGAG